MSRPISKTSKRQRGLKMLKTMKHMKREAAVEKLQERLDIGKSYAQTIHGTFRTQMKENKTMPQVFSVQDSRDGKKCKPYIRMQNVLKPKKADCLTPGEAKLAYIATLKKKLEQVNHL